MDSMGQEHISAHFDLYPQILNLCCNTGQNVTGVQDPCWKIATAACNGCLLVRYCGRECQVAHWPTHKSDCKSSLNKPSWKPGWESEGRKPTFINSASDTSTHKPFGGQKHLWGNVPAIDILNLHENEGSGYKEDFCFLFAASGDCRHLVKTIRSLPSSYTGSCEVIMNDKDMDIVARNAILLLVAFQFDPKVAAPIMLHLWYSSFVPAGLLSFLKKQILPLVQDVCTKIESKPSTVLLSKTWAFDNRTLRLTLRKPSWVSLLSYFDVPEGLSTERAENVRMATTLAPQRKDYVERRLYRHPPGQRVATLKFRHDGILLPFGMPRDKFNTPNPTFFQDKDSWPMRDGADPLAGWFWKDIVKSGTPARNDIYGHLSAHLYDTLLRFCQTCRRIEVKVGVFQVDILELPGLIGTPSEKPQQGFDRIEVSNVVDVHWGGTNRVLDSFSPLLRSPTQNPHATLVALYLNAVQETSTMADKVTSMAEEMELVQKYLPINLQALQLNRNTNPDILMFITAREMFRDFDGIFKRYMVEHDFETITKAAGLTLKDKHTIIPKWPMHLGRKATQEEFDQLLRSAHDGSERYVEWKRVV